jgi:putative membrane protein
MFLMPLLWIALIAVIVWAVVRLVQRPGDAGYAGQRPHDTGYAGQPRETPQEILDRRFALGEIDADAYTAARDHLARSAP